MKPLYPLLICSTLAISISACMQPQSEPRREPAIADTNIGHKDDRILMPQVTEALDSSQKQAEKPPQVQVTVKESTQADLAVSAPAAKQRSTEFVAISETATSAMVRASSFALPPLQQTIDRENYLPNEQNGIKQVTAEPVSTFSIDVDTAGYSNVRRMLVNEGRMPPHDAVRIEEMINYFSYNYKGPDSTKQPFSVTTELAPSPWNNDRKLLQIGLKGYEPNLAQRKAANLVFLIDVSGSMRDVNKLPLVKKSLKLLLNNLDKNDRIALVVYAGAAGLVLESTPASEKATITAAIDQLEAGGSTHGSAGIKLAYQVAENNMIADGVNRVLIASDGDMNVGTVSIEALKDLIEEKRKSGVALTTLGYGTGNYNYSLMEQLADVGNGNASYIDSLKEAQKVLVNEAQSTLLTIASDVKIQVEFNPAVVAEYRLIGYENRALKREDFTNDKVDAGEIGAGHTVTALYELTLAGSDQQRLQAMRYGKKDQQITGSTTTEELAFVKLRYKLPGEQVSTELTEPVLTATLKDTYDAASKDFRFASAVAAFGQMLSGGKYTDSFDFNDALQAIRDSRGDDPYGYRSELLSLVELAAGLSTTAINGG